MTAKCPCDKCGTHLEFHPSREGEWIECPHCNQRTFLAAPEPGTPEPTKQIDIFKPESQRRKELREDIYDGVFKAIIAASFVMAVISFVVWLIVISAR
jgi:hypothetical protein